jgi:uronate dehydrogenase
VSEQDISGIYTIDRLGLGIDPAPKGDIFITGGSGRIGTCLRQRLTPAGYKIRHTDIVPPADGDIKGYTQTDLADQDAMFEAMKGCRALVHLGGHPRETDWPTIQERNYTGTYNAFNAARRAGIKTIIYASSNHYCGLYPANTELNGHLEPRPTGLYGTSKVFAESILRAEAEAFGITAFAWRICTFKPEPTDARDLRLWHSWDDAARLVDKCLRWTEGGFNVIWGVSNNKRLNINDTTARRIGYQPKDDAEHYVEMLKSKGVDIQKISEWPYLGGEKANDWMTQKDGGLKLDPNAPPPNAV